MSTKELRKQIIDKIESINDDNVLAEFYRVLEMSESDEEVFQLTPAMIASINEGLEDIKHGRVISNEEANKEIEEWLSK